MKTKNNGKFLDFLFFSERKGDFFYLKVKVWIDKNIKSKGGRKNKEN